MDNVLQMFRKEPKKGIMGRHSRNGRHSRRSQSHSTRHCGARRLIRVHAAGPRVPRNAVLHHVCVSTEKGIDNQFIGRSKGGVADAHWGKS